MDTPVEICGDCGKFRERGRLRCSWCHAPYGPCPDTFCVREPCDCEHHEDRFGGRWYEKAGRYPV